MMDTDCRFSVIYVSESKLDLKKKKREDLLTSETRKAAHCVYTRADSGF